MKKIIFPIMAAALVATTAPAQAHRGPGPHIPVWDYNEHWKLPYGIGEWLTILFSRRSS